MIEKFSGDCRWLSNFWPVLVELDGLNYPSVEHAYQAAKTLDVEKRKEIQLAVMPSMAKMLGKKLKIRSDWEQIKIDVMYGLLQQKFAVGILRTQLKLTGSQELIEGNHWNDTFWGVCKGKGENHLGKLLMKVRAQL